MKIAVIHWTYQRQLPEGWPIKIRLSQKDNTVYYNTQLFVKKSYLKKGWVSPDHPKSKLYNSVIESKLEEARLISMTLKNATPEIVRDCLTGKLLYTTVDFVTTIDESISLEGFKEIFLKQYDNEQTAIYYRTKYEMMISFKPGTLLGQIDSKWLNSFLDYCKERTVTRNGKKRQVSNSTLKNMIKTVKKIVNYACECNYLQSSKLQHYKPSKAIQRDTSIKKKPITLEQFNKLKELQLLGRLNDVRNIFLTQVYLEGARISDVLFLSWNEVHEDYIAFTPQKTDTTNKEKIVPISKGLKKIINQYPRSRKYIFPFIKDQTKHSRGTNRITQVVNEDLKILGSEIGHSNLTSHIARHTYSDFLERAGFVKADITDALLHSSPKVTEAYVSNSMALKRAAERINRVFG